MYWLTEKSRRLGTMGILIILVFLILLLRIAWLQILQGPQYKRSAEENRIIEIYNEAPRGIIYDRNGVVLVANRPSFAASILPNEFNPVPESVSLLSDIVHISANDLIHFLQSGKERPYTPIKIKRDIDPVMVAKLEEHKNYLPGVIIEAVPVRHYIYDELAAHVLGYVGIIDALEYQQRKTKGYLMQSLIGKDGLEKVWEDVLRGKDGAKLVEKDATGREKRIIGDIIPVAGSGLQLALDSNLQKIADSALREQVKLSQLQGQPATGGCIIVANVKNGEILVMTNFPSYNPNLFATGISSNEWAKLLDDKRHPLSHRAIQNTYPPGSVFKIITAAAALQDKYTTPEEIFDDRGVYVLNGWSFHGWKTEGLGKLTIVDAIAWSSDPAFYELGHRIGINRLAAYALTFGLGKKTGIKLPGEKAGIVPTKEWKQSVFQEPWYPGETLISAIGQGYNLVTPLQQILLVMAVANRGIIYKPKLVRSIIAADGKADIINPPEVIYTVDLDSAVWKVIEEGLHSVTTEGTAAGVFKTVSYSLAGKTGSAETGRETTHAWFACYAPVEDPEIAVVTFVENGGEGSVAAAPLAKKVLDAYFAAR